MASTGRTADHRPCPVCGDSAVERGEPEFPFCSRRCRLVDLGRWLNEDYRIPEDDERD